MKIRFYCIVYVMLFASSMLCKENDHNFGFFVSTDFNKTHVGCTFGSLFGRLELVVGKTFDHSDKSMHSNLRIQLLAQRANNITDRTLNTWLAQSGQIFLDRTIEEVAGRSTRTDLIIDRYVCIQEEMLKKLYAESIDTTIKHKIKKILLLIEKKKQSKV